MPVQSEYYCKVKPVCDRLAVLASQCNEKEFDKRFDILEALCESWSESDVQTQVPSSGSVTRANNNLEYIAQQSEVDTMTYSKEFVSVCCKKFQSTSQLAQHHTVPDVTDKCIEKCPYVCCVCCKRYESSIELLQHLKHHENHIPLKSTTCPALSISTNKDGCDITGSSNKELLTCRHCGEQFRTRTRLQSHVRSQHRVPREHSCPECGSCCKSARELRFHLRGSHAASVKKYVCDVCGQCFGRSVNLRDHRRSHRELQTFNGSKNGVLSAFSSDKSLRCKDCGADNFKSWRSLMAHRRTRHGGPLPHTCSHCPRQFLYASDLRKHERRHTGQRPHICPVCSKGFFHVADLEVHGRAHRGDAPLTCGVCNKWMSSMTGLRGHMQIHRPNAPPNVCSVCKKQFSYLSSLRTHMKRQHAGTDDKTSEWRCVKCNSIFSSQSLLDDHATNCNISMYVVCCFTSSVSVCCGCCFLVMLLLGF